MPYNNSYYTVKPCQNRLLQKKFDESAQERHRRELDRVKAVIDTRPPQSFQHTRSKTKKAKLEEERQAKIEQENQQLQDRMRQIKKSKGVVDNVNRYEAKSLNIEKRQRDSRRVEEENEALTERVLLAGDPRDTWQADWARNLALIERISRFPNTWWERDARGGGRRDGSSPRKTSRSEQHEQHEQQQQQQEASDDKEAAD